MNFMEKDLVIVVLAAGQGTRMKSAMPKVIHPIGGKPMLVHVIETARQLLPRDIYVVYGYGGDRVISEINQPGVHWCLQEKQLGTGHALSQALPKVSPEQTVLILYGDVPLIGAQTLKYLLQSLDSHALSLLSVELEDPIGYGRIIRDKQGMMCRIAEEKDATCEQKKISEINTGIMCAGAEDLARWLNKVQNNNSQGEYYLTDCVEVAVEENRTVNAVICHDAYEVMGINDKRQLAACERRYQQRETEQLMLSGVTLYDPSRVDIRGKLTVAQDISIDINVVFEGEVNLGNRVSIGPNCLIKNATIGDDTQIKANTVIEDAEIGVGCQIGPYTRIRPETYLADEVHLGNFVEIKKSSINKQSKVNHLSYIGDSQVGKRVNVGAGTITCNYDGAYKHATLIGDDAFIGSDTQFIAPVKVGNGATIGAGSTITKDAPDNQLTLSRADQISIDGWERPRKKRV
jgi:bifunctional UDP-N-acetylglucosamine pyrophosphorylase/glucosamine-1-phosphate N-acetyltransferase